MNDLICITEKISPVKDLGQNLKAGGPLRQLTYPGNSFMITSKFLMYFQRVLSKGLFHCNTLIQDLCYLQLSRFLLRRGPHCWLWSRCHCLRHPNLICVNIFTDKVTRKPNTVCNFGNKLSREENFLVCFK